MNFDFETSRADYTYLSHCNFAYSKQSSGYGSKLQSRVPKESKLSVEYGMEYVLTEKELYGFQN